MNPRAAAALTIVALLLGPWLFITALELFLIYPAWPADWLGWAALLALAPAWILAESGAKKIFIRERGESISSTRFSWHRIVSALLITLGFLSVGFALKGRLRVALAPHFSTRGR